MDRIKNLMGEMGETQSSENKKTVLIPIANGSEDIECVTLVDVLRRGGAEVELSSVEANKEVTMSKGTKVVADSFINDVKDKDYSAIILPGGHEGSISLSNSDTLRTMLNAHAKSNKVYGGLCAAPAKVLHKWGLLHGKRATSYPDKEYQDEMSEHQQPENFQERTIRDGNVLTSQGPGSAMEFSLSVLSAITDQENAEKVKKSLACEDNLRIVN